jgi:hypothetical protein
MRPISNFGAPPDPGDLGHLEAMEKGLQAAVRRFPARSQEIIRLAFANSSFRALCDDLADAELALDRLAKPASSGGALRCSEYADLVKELAEEIEQFLRNAARDSNESSAT